MAELKLNHVKGLSKGLAVKLSSIALSKSTSMYFHWNSKLQAMENANRGGQ